MSRPFECSRLLLLLLWINRVALTDVCVRCRPVPSSIEGWTVWDMMNRAWEYFDWAAHDTSGRVIGLRPWHWKSVNFTGGYW